MDAQRDAPLAPIIYTTAEQTLQRIQAQYGDKASSERVEQLFAALAAALKAKGFTRFIVAGGETSSIVAQTLGVEAFHIGPTISPRIPWVRDTRQPLSLALKSGNFGDIQFFARAQQEFVMTEQQLREEMVQIGASFLRAAMPPAPLAICRCCCRTATCWRRRPAPASANCRLSGCRW